MTSDVIGVKVLKSFHFIYPILSYFQFNFFNFFFAVDSCTPYTHAPTGTPIPTVSCKYITTLSHLPKQYERTLLLFCFSKCEHLTPFTHHANVIFDLHVWFERFERTFMGSLKLSKDPKRRKLDIWIKLSLN